MAIGRQPFHYRIFAKFAQSAARSGEPSFYYAFMGPLVNIEIKQYTITTYVTLCKHRFVIHNMYFFVLFVRAVSSMNVMICNNNFEYILQDILGPVKLFITSKMRVKTFDSSAQYDTS